MAKIIQESFRLSKSERAEVTQAYKKQPGDTSRGPWLFGIVMKAVRSINRKK